MKRKHIKRLQQNDAGGATGDNGLIRYLAQPIAFASTQFQTNWEYFRAVSTPVAIFAAVTFPLYYVVWEYVFPQPYENLPMRLLGSVGCLFLALRAYWPPSLLRYEQAIWYVMIVYVSPLFFTYFLLKSGTTQVATLSLLAMTFILVLIVDWLNLILVSILGGFLGWSLYIITDHRLIPPNFDLEFLAVWWFVVVVGSVANYKSELVTRERMRAMMMAAGNIAHEMRTPLLAIKANATALSRHLPKLIEAYGLARENGVDVSRIRRGQLTDLESTTQRISTEVDQANVVIDMLLYNAGRVDVQPEELRICSIKRCVDQALARYVFNSATEREAVGWDGKNDFEFKGSEQMVIHVLFNLLKNALYFVQRDRQGRITIEIRNDEDWNLLIVWDDGPGISPSLLPKIFEPFVTQHDGGVGTGLGLAYCRMVMRGLGGDITCRSELGQFTEFRLRFPKI